LGFIVVGSFGLDRAERPSYDEVAETAMSGRFRCNVPVTEVLMKPLIRRFALSLAAATACIALLGAQSVGSLPIPGIDPAKDIPGAKNVPDPTLTYRVLFDMAAAPATPSDVNPMLQTAARYLNTLAKAGVPADRRKLAVIIHQGGTPAVLKNAEYKARNRGQDNPNIPLMQALARAGVELHVCGKGVLGAKIDPSDIQPEVQLDLWALTTIVDFVQRGYVRVGG
jgi:intracellular sulfur oxidation DsrE/DsrF family protein